MKMTKVPFIFKRVAAAFAEVESSGSENSTAAESLTDLSELVNSFLENNEGSEVNTGDWKNVESENNYIQTKGLKSVLAKYKDDEAKINIIKAVEKVVDEIGINCLPLDFNLRLIAWLRYKGFDAGLCKSKWEKSNHVLAGSHEYIDVLVAGNRYIMDVYLAKEFEIARPTRSYVEELNNFPPIFVGNRDELKEIVKLMCKCMKESMKTMEMPLPPWRRFAYVRAKWFTSNYIRTTTNIEYAAVQKPSNLPVGFGPFVTSRMIYRCATSTSQIAKQCAT